MRRGIMVFDVYSQSWKIWIGQQSYESFEGVYLEVRIRNQYYQSCLGKDDDWFVTIEDDIAFDLRIFEVYKVRVPAVDLVTQF